MGILLETVLPDRRFLIRLSLWRFGLCLASAMATGVCFSRPAFNAPLRWLLTAGFWVLMDVGWCLAGLYSLCFLFRRVEFYENGIYAEPCEIPLEKLECVRWKQEPFRLLGIFPLPLPARERMICVWREGKHLRRLGVSGFYFADLREVFDEAYLFSLPWEFIPYKRKKKPAPARKETETPMGPAVPPSPPPSGQGRGDGAKQQASENAGE